MTAWDIPSGMHCWFRSPRVLQAHVRKSDTLARLGGDEFTVVLGGLHIEEDALTVAKILLDGLAAPFLIEGHHLNIGASIGISVFPENSRKTLPILMQQADSAMYAAKRRWQKSSHVLQAGAWVHGARTPESGEPTARCTGHGRDRGVLPTRIRRRRKGRLVRFEALARWTHPTLGPISPGKFIPVAEESGLIVALGLHILERACSEAVKWQKAAPFPVQVAVNVSTIQFGRPTFVDEVKEILDWTGLDPTLATGTYRIVMINGIHSSAETMNRLKRPGHYLRHRRFRNGIFLSYLFALAAFRCHEDRPRRSCEMSFEARTEAAMVNRSSPWPITLAFV